MQAGTRAVVIGSAATSVMPWVERIADDTAAQRSCCHVILADPSEPAFGPVGSVRHGTRENGRWQLRGLEGVATLDGARFRGPVAVAAARLAVGLEGPLLVVLPGLERGVAARELPVMVAQAIGANRVYATESRPDLLGLVVERIAGAERRTDAQKRAQRRTGWHAWMRDSAALEMDLRRLPVLGLPPPDVDEAWKRRVVVLLGFRGETLGMGYVERRNGPLLHVSCVAVDQRSIAALCVRDAVLDDEGLPVTAEGPTGLAAEETRRARHQASGRGFELPRVLETAPVEIPPFGTSGPIVCDLANGVFGDPLLHVRLVEKRRSLLFDIGEAVGLPRRMAHQITHVFVSHAHMDHVAGLAWLVRMRVGVGFPCRLAGPPGFAQQFANQLDVFTWNLVGRDGPQFVVDEVHGHQLLTFEMRGGSSDVVRHVRTIREGLLLEDGDVRVRVVTVDHNTPVLSYRLEEPAVWNVLGDRLRSLGVEAGPWIGELKRAVVAGDLDGTVTLPDGRTAPTRDLARDLLNRTAGQVLCYVTDVADRPENMAALRGLVEGCDVLVCEAGFVQEDADRARATAHLTAAACGRLAEEAKAHRLVPFHFSARYEGQAERVYEEVRAEYGGEIVGMAVSE